MADPRQIGAALRALVRGRAAGCCEYCLSQERYSPDMFAIEHITPVARGGSGSEDNLALSCQGCNGRKYTATSARDSLTGEIAPLFHPRQDARDAHFAWGDGDALLIGLTSTGRATIDKLALNRPGLVSLRQILAAAGVHPPR